MKLPTIESALAALPVEKLQSEWGKLTLLFEDDKIFALNKPPGLHSVESVTSTEPSVASLLRAAAPHLVQVSPQKADVGLANRLDQFTSGILLGAHTRAGWEELRTVLSATTCQKLYIALLEGRVSKPLHSEGYLGNTARRSAKVKVLAEAPRSKDAARFTFTRAEYQPLQFIEKWNATLCIASLSSGARHQIRAHAGFQGHPLVGDATYGSKKNLAETLSVSAPPFFLHAYKIKLKDREIVADLPGWAAGVSEFKS